ncbi:hypothetical protein ILYODFUR_018231 [Ilyodon furcidens]|uniref:Uncharacterized protein n=1 Tax=Ilyodon furcidens TaxID=33524 RepID=A0ABV0UT05_9TELE
MPQCVPGTYSKHTPLHAEVQMCRGLQLSADLITTNFKTLCGLQISSRTLRRHFVEWVSMTEWLQRSITSNYLHWVQALHPVQVICHCTRDWCRGDYGVGLFFFFLKQPVSLMRGFIML